MKFLNFIRKPDNIIYIITIIIAILVAVLGLLDVVPANVLSATILMLLGSVTSILILLVHRLRVFRNQSIDDFLLEYNKEIESEIKELLLHANEIWLLSRTGQGWWRNYETVFRDIVRKVDTRFLFLDPENGALKMTAKRRKMEWQDKPDLTIIQSVRQFLTYLKNELGSTLALKVIDYLPAWTLLVIDPTKKTARSVIYVEMNTYNSASNGRPIFKVSPHNGKYFDVFLSEFKKMWTDARDWE